LFDQLQGVEVFSKIDLRSDTINLGLNLKRSQRLRLGLGMVTMSLQWCRSASPMPRSLHGS